MSSFHAPRERPSPGQLIAIVFAVAAVGSLRFVFGPFRLQGVLFVAVTAVAAWRIGPRTGLLAALLGIITAQVLRYIQTPSALLQPGTVINRQFLVGLATYALLSAVVLLVGRRHRITVEQLESTRLAREQDDRLHREQLEAALARERAARVEAEMANEEREQLLRRLVALTAASGALLRSPQVEDVVQAILGVARDLLPADAWAVWRRDAGSGQWDIEANEGTSLAFAQAGAPDNAAMHMQEPLPVPDVTAFPITEERRRVLEAEGIRSMLIVPLVTNGETTGTTVFYYRTPLQLSDAELLAARAFGNLASAALTTAMLYDRQRRSRTESEFLADVGVLLANSLDWRSTLAQVAQLAVPFFADFCAVDLVDENGGLTRLAVAQSDQECADDAASLTRRGQTRRRPQEGGLARIARGVESAGRRKAGAIEQGSGTRILHRELRQHVRVSGHHRHLQRAAHQLQRQARTPERGSDGHAYPQQALAGGNEPGRCHPPPLPVDPIDRRRRDQADADFLCAIPCRDHPQSPLDERLVRTLLRDDASRSVFGRPGRPLAEQLEIQKRRRFDSEGYGERFSHVGSPGRYRRDTGIVARDAHHGASLRPRIFCGGGRRSRRVSAASVAAARSTRASIRCE
jgi:GAF domain-containing protein